MDLEGPEHHKLFCFRTVLRIVGGQGRLVTILFLFLTTDEIHTLTL